MRRTVFLIALVAALVVAFAVPGLALANFAIHGGYVQDTDSCAGCHRAHTSASSITWADSYQVEHSALLVSQATEMYQFCYACHDGTAQGADTDVQFGQYDGTLYGSQTAALNGGGFEKVGGISGPRRIRTTARPGVRMVVAWQAWV
jgi:cytochrome c553